MARTTSMRCAARSSSAARSTQRLLPPWVLNITSRRNPARATQAPISTTLASAVFASSARVPAKPVCSRLHPTATGGSTHSGRPARSFGGRLEQAEGDVEVGRQRQVLSVLLDRGERQQRDRIGAGEPGNAARGQVLPPGGQQAWRSFRSVSRGHRLSRIIAALGHGPTSPCPAPWCRPARPRFAARGGGRMSARA